MAYKYPPNPNTAYGRKRIREETFQNQQQYKRENPNQESGDNNVKAVFGVIVLIVIIFLWFVFHTDVFYFKDNSKNVNSYYGARGGHYKINSHGNKQYYKK